MNKRVCVPLSILLCVCMQSYALFEYDRAVHRAQQADWASASDRLNQLVTSSPDRPDVLYDAGVAAYKNGDYQQAKAYFDSATALEYAPRTLKEQAYYNKGNAHVQLDELKEALLAYEQALMLNPENEQAAHNKEVVKDMLKKQPPADESSSDKQDKQKQEDQQKQDGQESDQQDSEQDQEQDQQKQDGQGSDQQDESEKSDSSDKQESKQDQQGDQSEDKEDQEQENGESQASEQDQQEDQGEDKDEQAEKSSESQEPKSEQSKQEPQEPEPAGAGEDEKEEVPEEEGAGAGSAEAELEEQEDEVVPAIDERLLGVLQQQEARDAQLNKAVIRANVKEQMAGEDGQNCW